MEIYDGHAEVEDEDDDQSHAVVMGRNCTSPIRQTRLDQDNKIENYTVLSQANRQIIQVTVGESRQNY